MRVVNQKAWSILMDDEKLSLSLQLGMQKSSWESGEIMNKSHYKYLEIKYRAEKFLKMFTEHCELYLEVIPEYIKGDAHTIEYFRKCIEKRLKPAEAIFQINSSGSLSLIKKKELNKKIITQIEDWRKSTNAHNQTMLALVLEFDRWNNYRILPKEVQEPSAFKRRLKNKHKKHLNTLTHIHPLGLVKLQKLYKTNRSPFNFLPLIVENEVKVIKVKDTLKAMEEFCNLGFYVFKTEVTASEYISSVYNYQYKEDRACRDGLEFWPKYREYIKMSLNYARIQQINPQRKFLDTAMKNLHFI